MEPLVFETDIYFKVGPARVWDSLTNPQKTVQYMYGCTIHTDWEIGSPLTWETEIGGQRIVAVQGELVELKHFKLLQFTVFVPNSGLKDEPRNYILSTYELFRHGEGTRLHVTLGDYACVDNGPARYEDTRQIWSAVTPKLIEVAEARESHQVTP